MLEFWGWEFETRKKNGKRDNGELADKKTFSEFENFLWKCVACLR